MDKSELIEIYSASKAIEAYTVANALEAAGIRAHVEGELSGGLPIGQTITPSVCVWKEDEGRARELLEQWQTEAKNTPEAEEPESEPEKSPPEESAESAEESLVPSSSGRNIGLLSPLLGIVGIACISVCIFYSIENHFLLKHYSKTVQGDLIDSALYSRWLGSGGLFDIATNNRMAYFWKTWYIYKVNDILYTVEVDRENRPTPNILIRYNPGKPADCRVGAILHPGWCLAFGGILGALVLFLAYQFR